MKFYGRSIIAVLTLFQVTAAHALPEIQSWKTDKGAKVMFVEAHELPMVDVRIVFDAGGARDGKQPGIASLTNALLDQGAAGLNADQIAQGF
jgi:zinc protease